MDSHVNVYPSFRNNKKYTLPCFSQKESEYKEENVLVLFVFHSYTLENIDKTKSSDILTLLKK